MALHEYVRYFKCSEHEVYLRVTGFYELSIYEWRLKGWYHIGSFKDFSRNNTFVQVSSKECLTSIESYYFLKELTE